MLEGTDNTIKLQLAVYIRLFLLEVGWFINLRGACCRHCESTVVGIREQKLQRWVSLR